MSGRSFLTLCRFVNDARVAHGLPPLDEESVSALARVAEPGDGITEAVADFVVADARERGTCPTFAQLLESCRLLSRWDRRSTGTGPAKG